ncbi:MAG: hypothetical protein ACOC8F_06495 [Planctomycetota bacterium]
MRPAGKTLPHADRARRAALAALRLLSSSRLGVGLLGLTAAYLAVVSVVEAPLARWLDVPRAGVYAWWPLPLLGGATCVVMLAATIARVPPRAPHLGAWAAHLGVAAVAAGGLWYAVAAVAGQCVTVRTPEGYRPVRHVYLSDTAAVYVARSPDGPWRQQRLDGLRAEFAAPPRDETRDLDVTLKPRGDLPTIHVVALRTGRLLARAQDGAHRAFDAALRVEVGAERSTAQVPFAPFAPYAPRVAVRSDGRRIYLRFSRFRRPLRRPIAVADPQYVTFAGSSMPRDYRCTLTTDGRVDTLTLHDAVSVGPWRLTHGRWLPDGPEPERIILNASTRPGVWLVWLGCALMAVGLPYAFFIKPLLLRRKELPG